MRDPGRRCQAMREGGEADRGGGKGHGVPGAPARARADAAALALSGFQARIIATTGAISTLRMPTSTITRPATAPSAEPI
ncbi:hypothetical protein SDC9_39138 [bioreactor metagenome]|uniref:Uncharacterized protein n=1 Tax=bioreactor metagenome TaxID=1076179 RepID=A0A644VNL2_9ZZZZ